LGESRDPEGKRFPDLAGAALLVIASSVLMLAIVQGQSWGWTSVRILGLLAGAVVLTAAFLYRSATHAAPVLELGLFCSRAFSAANIASTLFFAAFGAMLLSNVLFLTRVWHEDILTAGLQISPGPIMAAVLAVPGSILSARYGQRAIAAIGALLFASGGVWWLTHVGLQPNYLTGFLPGMLAGGSGVGLVIPTLASAVAASLPAALYATGSAVYGMTRQFGIALGIAVLIAILGTPHGAEILGAFQHGWEAMFGSAVASAIAALAIGRIRTAPVQARATRDLERAVS
jgi:MFS family permease